MYSQSGGPTVGGPLYFQAPGDLSRWMAVPWQTDTSSCRSGSCGPTPPVARVGRMSDARPLVWLPFDADITVDLREGGDMVFVGRGDEPLTMTFTIRRVEAPMLLEHTHVDPGSFVRWELEPVGDGCVLQVDLAAASLFHVAGVSRSAATTRKWTLTSSAAA